MLPALQINAWFGTHEVPLQSRQQNNKHLATAWISKANGCPLVDDKFKNRLDSVEQFLQDK